MKDIIIIYPKYTKYKDNAFDWFKEIAKKLDMTLEIAFLEELKSLKKAKYVIMRHNDIELIRDYEQNGFYVINSSKGSSIAKDKLETSKLLLANDILTPQYYDKNNYDEIVFRFGSEFIAKKRYGSKGEGVYLIDSFEKFKSLEEDYIYYEYIKESKGKDLRVYVLGDKVLAVIKRENKNDFRSNMCLGAEVYEYPLDKEILDIVKKVRKVIDLEFFALDLLFSKKGLSVCEINHNAGFRSVSKATNIDMVYEILSFIKRKMEE